MSEAVSVWGLPLSVVTLNETVDAISAMIADGSPSLVITANTNYAMLTEEHPRLRLVNRQAALVLADGAPLVVASRWHETRLPERVAGSDLIFAICQRAAEEGHKVYLLGGADGVAETAATELIKRYPNLQIAGTEAPPHRRLTTEENDALIARIKDAGTQILFVAFGQPKGEFWISDHMDALGVPVSMQVGASLDFAAGRVRRAPRLLQKIGFEWAYRLWLEPGRLGPRYAKNARFIFRQLASDLLRRARGPRPPSNDMDFPTSTPENSTEDPSGTYARAVQ